MHGRGLRTIPDFEHPRQRHRPAAGGVGRHPLGDRPGGPGRASACSPRAVQLGRRAAAASPGRIRALFAVGDEVEISLGYVDDLHPVMVGRDHQPRAARSPAMSRRRSPSAATTMRHRLARGRKTAHVLQMADSAIAGQVAREAGLRAAGDGHGLEAASYVLQSNQSDLGVPAAAGRAASATRSTSGTRSSTSGPRSTPARRRSRSRSARTSASSPRGSARSRRWGRWRFAAGT